MAITVDPTSIVVKERQRRSMNRQQLDDLKASILDTGLYHAPVCTKDTVTGEWILVAGERRLTVIREIHESGQFFLYDGRAYPPGEAPITTVSEPTALNLAKVEAEENLMRENFNWVDQTRALALIHELAKQANPDQTVSQTAKDLEAKNIQIGNAKTANSLRKEITVARVVAAHLDDPEIAKSRNQTEAYAKILKREETTITAQLKEKVLADPSKIRCQLIKGDAISVMADMPDGHVDLILVDPPYGIGADSAGYRSRSPLAHEYDDSKEKALAVIQSIILEGWRLTKNRANLLMFLDIDLFVEVKGMCSRVGWEPFRTAIIWNKSMTEGMNPWGSNGPNRTHEIILYATKGQRGMLRSTPDVMFCPRVPDSNKVFAAQKPFGLLRDLIELTTIPGDLILDPCAGSGASLRTARILGRPSIGIEQVESTYNTALSFMDTPLTAQEQQLGAAKDDDL